MVHLLVEYSEYIDILITCQRPVIVTSWMDSQGLEGALHGLHRVRHDLPLRGRTDLVRDVKGFYSKLQVVPPILLIGGAPRPVH